MARHQPFFPKSHGKPRANDRRVLSGIIFINRNDLRWRGGRAIEEFFPVEAMPERGIFTAFQ